MTKFIASLILIVSLSGCGPKQNTYYLLTDSGDGISQNTIIQYKGIEVGKITKIDFASDKIKLTLSTQPNVKIAKTSTLYMDNGKLVVSKANDNNTYPEGSTIVQNLDRATRLEAKGKNLEKFVIDMIDTVFSNVGREVIDELRQELK